MSVKASARKKNVDGQLSPRVAAKQPQLVVDRETKKNNSIQSIAEAVADAPPGSKIQIASNIYDEGMVIEVPELTLEPKDLGGEVTIQQHISPCLIIDIGTDNVCTVNNIRMLLKGPNKDADIHSFQVHSDFEKTPSEKCMKEFFAHKPDDLYCIILLRSGTLRLNGCTMSLDGMHKETHKKVPCIAAMPGTRLEVFDCKLKGDTINDADTAGILCVNADLNVRRSTMAHFKSGAIMATALPQNMLFIGENEIMTCETAGIYLQGRASKPVVCNNKIKFCRCVGITTNLDVDANIYGNEMSLNERGIEILNNKSRCIDNIIDKAHDNGILIMGDNKATKCTPAIWRNKIRSCGANGIFVQGEQCEPDIRGNVILQCRKSGIKLSQRAVAHIGGSSKVDIKFIPSVKETSDMINATFQTAKVEAVRNYRTAAGVDMVSGEELNNAAEDRHLQDGAVAVMRGLDNIPQILQASFLEMDAHQEEVLTNINIKSFPNANVIMQNFNQGILIVEGSYARILANKIDANIKANIALGGKVSGLTRIKYNYIENSKSEGIFVIEGEEKLLIEDNQIIGNNDGIVLVDSEGFIRENMIKSNQRSGILTAAQTTTVIDSNIIEDNQAAGILIKDPSLPEIRRNEITKNFFQVKMEKHMRKEWTRIEKENPKIIGNNEIPGNTCTIF